MIKVQQNIFSSKGIETILEVTTLSILTIKVQIKYISIKYDNNQILKGKKYGNDINDYLKIPHFQ